MERLINNSFFANEKTLAFCCVHLKTNSLWTSEVVVLADNIAIWRLLENFYKPVNKRGVLSAFFIQWQLFVIMIRGWGHRKKRTQDQGLRNTVDNAGGTDRDSRPSVGQIIRRHSICINLWIMSLFCNLSNSLMLLIPVTIFKRGMKHAWSICHLTIVQLPQIKSPLFF